MAISPILQATIEQLHNTPHKAVIEVAGAGTQAISWLHSIGGSSRTVLEASDRYAATSVGNLLGFSPEQYVAPQVAQLMANRAYLRARQLVEDSSPVVGLGCSAAIATDRERKGEHRCHVAFQKGGSMLTLSLTMHKGTRTREAEENLVSTLIIKALTTAFETSALKIDLMMDDKIVAKRNEHDLLSWLNTQNVDYVSIDSQGVITAGRQLANIALLSGSFNPLHEGHRKLARVASEYCGREIYFELTLQNADKAPISLTEAEQRASQFRDVGTALLTRTPLFSQKAKLFPGSVFVIGTDTAKRLVQPRFYDDDPGKMDASLKLIQHSGCRFLVAGRQELDTFVTLADLDIPPQHQCLFEAIPEKTFRNDISSTAIREGRA
jgi:hypothetical protein